jgi:hypothetical protein
MWNWRNRPGKPSPRRARRPAFEMLEGRAMLAAVQLSVTFDSAAKTWEVRASVTGGDNQGLAGFGLDVAGSNGITVATSRSVGPRDDAGQIGFINQIVDGNPGPGRNITGLQDTDSVTPGRVLRNVGIQAGLAGDNPYEANVLIASGTYTGDTGTLTITALEGGASVLPLGWDPGENPVLADSYLGASVPVTVANSPPVANDDTATVDQDFPQTINVLANDTDANNDTLTVASFTQGTNGTVAQGAGGALIYTPRAGFVGGDSFTYTASDGRGGTDTATVQVTVQEIVDQVFVRDDPLNPGRQALFVFGTANRDRIALRPSGDAENVIVNMNGRVRGTFPVDDLSRFVITARAGNDSVVVSNRFQTDTRILGGAGRDKLVAGGGNSATLGGEGRDALIGGANNDLLIGGTEGDRVIAKNGSDLVIGGSTQHDASDASINSILQEWSSSRDYTTRVDRLRSGADGLPALSSTTVIDDSAADRVLGQRDLDWFIIGMLFDMASDREEAELVN